MSTLIFACLECNFSRLLFSHSKVFLDPSMKRVRNKVDSKTSQLCFLKKVFHPVKPRPKIRGEDQYHIVLNLSFKSTLKMTSSFFHSCSGKYRKLDLEDGGKSQFWGRKTGASHTDHPVSPMIGKRYSTQHTSVSIPQTYFNI